MTERDVVSRGAFFDVKNPMKVRGETVSAVAMRIKTTGQTSVADLGASARRSEPQKG
jgi:hypothetical protein